MPETPAPAKPPLIQSASVSILVLITAVALMALTVTFFFFARHSALPANRRTLVGVASAGLFMLSAAGLLASLLDLRQRYRSRKLAKLPADATAPAGEEPKA